MISALVSCCNTYNTPFPINKKCAVAVIRQIEFLWKTVQYPTEPRVAAPRREVRAGLTIRGPHTNVRWGPFSHARTQNFLSQGALFFSQKVDDFF